MTLEDILGTTLAAQCRLVPQPEDLRGHILAHNGLWVPLGQNVEAWLLENAKKLPPPPAVPIRQPRPPRIEVACEESGRSWGHCSYTARYTSSGTVSMPETELHRRLRDVG